ncbi:hypothetical protein CRM22_009071 [Opisthorchis felineus]|uniref:Ig-like domain-containing protein n=1 Tax=Opisthorchis felineus TaxID=147828 RepID=A0A4S2L930_OPIFE|nr:hypothetical protein CRM22_009071 [Opisthorchis felineus]
MKKLLVYILVLHIVQYVSIVHSAAAGDIKGVKFEPPDGTLYVGSSQTIKCSLDAEKPVEKTGTFNLTASGEHTTLINLNNNDARIEPPTGQQYYTNTGQTNVTCNWTETGGANQSYVKTLEINILPATTSTGKSFSGQVRLQDVVMQRCVGRISKANCDYLHKPAGPLVNGYQTVVLLPWSHIYMKIKMP